MVKPEPNDLDPLWEDQDWAIGQMLFMGWDGTEVTPQIRSLIEDHHLGSILLTAKNLKSAHETAKLVQELQTIAHQAGHPHPLLIALDQENGGVNSLFDEDYICQFPSAMGMAAASSHEMAYEVAKATATEVSAVGVNLILGPVLDVLNNARYQPLGVRAYGDDPHEASLYANLAIDGFKDAGVATCGKHFPSYGNLDFLGSNLDVPIITQTLEELSLSALVPFRQAIRTGKLDSMFVGGCGVVNPSMNINHACLSDQVVDELLRSELGFEGVAISECLEMEALSHEIGVKGGTVMAVEAGCDLVLLCRAFDVQKEAISGLKLGVENGIISKDRIYTSLRRVLKMKAGCTSWATALNPPGLSLLSKIHPSHLALSEKAYSSSITIVRDRDKLIPLSQSMDHGEDLLLLTPLVKPLPASAATKVILEGKNNRDIQTIHDKWNHRERGAIMSGEGVFKELGKSLARRRVGTLLHSSYTASGVRPIHENLINRASAIIIVTADANRNLYQAGFTKHIGTICSLHRSMGQKKNFIVVAVSSPYDFAMDKSIGTYVCTFDFTETAMHALTNALFGEFNPQSTLPGTLRKAKRVAKSRQIWLVEPYDQKNDADGLDELLKSVCRAAGPKGSFLSQATAASFETNSPTIEEAHFIVRNSSTGALYGFCATYFYPGPGTGAIGALIVDPAKRNLSIGRSLHLRAMRNMIKNHPGTLKKMQLGASYPAVFLGMPVAEDESGSVRGWYASQGWDVQFPKRLTNLHLENLAEWSAPEGLLQSIQRASISFDLIHGLENGESALRHVEEQANVGVVELYRAALSDTKQCGVVRAKSAEETLLGTVIVCRPGSRLSSRVPPLAGDHVGGIVAPVVPTSAQSILVLQGLALMGLRQSKQNKSANVALSWVPDDLYEPLIAMGFEVAQAFEEITNSADNWGHL
ncbi:putative glycoside hydrolase family 3 protein [Zalerion maritima]|uniref:Glycoside hydrolase family 3 protein n=1 Tax=Zalerion maritima TaxID=339359 RepID=A0AAD5RI92_9PEZI|nr:putative glycoside hydrolase family 3 protein [Zalerion maritima]